MIKRAIQPEYKSVVNIYAPNIGAPKYINKTRKGDMYSKTTIIGDLNTPFSTMGTLSGQRINKETDLNNTIDQVDLTDIYKLFYPTTAECSLLKHKWNIFYDGAYVRKQNKC